MTTGVLLINLGTPDAPAKKAVRSYLRQFLMDPRVIDLPKLVRAILVYGLIIPFRTKSSTHAYQSIWTAEGSPLLVYGEQLQARLAETLGEDFQVVLGMRYGNPSIPAAVARLKACKKIIVLPLFPQYASAANGSAIQCALEALKQSWNLPDIHVISQFYQDPGFIAAFSAQIAAHKQPDDFLLMSYHGLPERHLDKSQCQAACDRVSACPAVSKNNAFCYRAQCYATARLLADALQLSDKQYTVAFQSRLGKVPWIKPYTDEILSDLLTQGHKNLSVVCPAFVADCLETLEEIGMRLKAQWQSLGGERLTLVPCLNAEGAWVSALKTMVVSYAHA